MFKKYIKEIKEHACRIVHETKMPARLVAAGLDLIVF